MLVSEKKSIYFSVEVSLGEVSYVMSGAPGYVCARARPRITACYSLRWLITVLMEYKSTTFNSLKKGFKLFFPSLFSVCLSLLPFYVKFEQLNVHKWPK